MENLESIPAAETPPASATPQLENVKELLDEGAQRIEEAAAQPVPRLRQKNKGGRPRNSKDKNPRKRPGENPVEAADAKTETPPPPPPPGTYLAISKMIVSAPFAFAAKKYGFEGWKLDEDEVTETGKLLDAVLIKYFPNLGADDPVWLFFCGVGAIGFFKYQAYAKWIESQGKEKTE